MGTHPIFESDFDCLTEMAAPLSPRSVNTCCNMKNLCLQSDSNPWLKIHIVTQQTASAITERKFEKSLIIGQFKGKLEMLTGCNAASMKLSIEDLKGKKIGEIDDEERLLGSYPIDDGMSIRVTDPEAIDWNNLDRVEKQEMDEETYDTFKPTSVKPTVREYKVKFYRKKGLPRLIFCSAFINLENSIPNFKRKLKRTGNKKKKT